MRIENRSPAAPGHQNNLGLVRWSVPMGALLAALCGCSQAALRPPSPATAAVPEAEAPARALSGWAFVDGSRLPLRLRLPFASEWQRRETSTSLYLEHVALRTQILIRLWPAARLVTSDQCLSELALLEPDVAAARQTRTRPMTTRGASFGDNPEVDSAEFVAEKPFEPGRDFHGFVRASVNGTNRMAAPLGMVVAVAAGVGRCIALVATTSVAGENAEQALAFRLAWLVEGSTASLKLQTVEGRVSAKP